MVSEGESVKRRLKGATFRTIALAWNDVSEGESVKRRLKDKNVITAVEEFSSGFQKENP